ncbi:hypothetical protein [Prosthecobacter vanneervenii]|uniref:Uncharacterized protein n=1 Tax=Prosthecobacter vanneervenii TaxID=48466 RepID=A0A7W8DMJ4_9BACT|nr:hypothetical protein [Prosthecobacter vanneervenii]MBB5035403.1 hypothetical protein [Prosthecobacter vanneervenii]
MKTKIYSLLIALLMVLGMGTVTVATASDFATDVNMNHPLAGLRPAMDFRGRYPALLKSMRAGHVYSISPDNVQRYGYPTLGKYNGQVYWMVPVQFYTLGGDTSYQQLSDDGRPLPRISRSRYSASRQTTDAYACVRNGVVEHWIYKISKAPIR